MKLSRDQVAEIQKALDNDFGAVLAKNASLRAVNARLVEALRDIIRSHSIGHEANARALLGSL